MIKIGYNLLTWSAVLSDDLLPIAERLKKIGYDGLECSMGAQDMAAYRRFGKQANDLGMVVNCCLAVGAEENPVSESADVRAKGLDRIKWAVDCATEMNGTIVCGPFHSAFATFSGRPPAEEEYARSAEVLHAAGEYAAQAGVTLSLEALNRFECYLCNTVAQLKSLIARVDHPNVTAMFDTHHANMEEKKFKAAIDDIAPVLSHVHISENDRGTPGDGNVPWDETFAALAGNGYSGWMTIESFTRNDPDFANAINVWRQYSEPWDTAEQGFKFIKEMSKKHGLMG